VRLRADTKEKLLKLVDETGKEQPNPTRLPEIVYCYCGFPIHSPIEFYKGWPLYALQSGYNKAVEWYTHKDIGWRYDQHGGKAFLDYKTKTRWLRAKTKEELLKLIDKARQQKCS
jgi:hypothetical protein